MIIEAGELGLGHSNAVTVPTEIPTPETAEGFILTDVQSRIYEDYRGCSTFFTCVDAQGEKKFFACGYNEHGELGLGHSNGATVPTEIPTPKAAMDFRLNDMHEQRL